MLILLLLLILVQGSSITNNNFDCGVCLTLQNSHRNQTGYQCHYEDDTAVRAKFVSNENKFQDCVPNNFEITRDIKEFCCFWSPESGCSVLASRKTFPRRVCDLCREFCTSPQDNVDDTSSKDKNTGDILSLLLLFFTIFVY